jgi:hypothetical protein
MAIKQAVVMMRLTHDFSAVWGAGLYRQSRMKNAIVVAV